MAQIKREKQVGPFWHSQYIHKRIYLTAILRPMYLFHEEKLRICGTEQTQTFLTRFRRGVSGEHLSPGQKQGSK